MNKTLDPDRLIGVRQMAEKLDKPIKQIYQLVKLGKIPQPIRFDRTFKWRMSTIDAWIDSLERQAAERTVSA